MKEDVREFSLEAIQPNLRLIQHLDAVEELCRSIQSLGQTQPIHVWFDGGRFRIVDGEKRWRACRKLGMTVVKAVIVEMTFKQTIPLRAEGVQGSRVQVNHILFSLDP